MEHNTAFSILLNNTLYCIGQTSEAHKLKVTNTMLNESVNLDKNVNLIEFSIES